jgi:phage tail-like protein
MALTKEQIATTYPLPVYNYKVEIDGKTIAFSEVSGLSTTYDTITHAESPTAGVGPHWMYMPAQMKPVNITMKKGVVVGVSVPTLFAWINSIQLNRVDKKDIYVRLCDETGAAVVSWKVINAFPTKLTAPTFTASSNDVAVESLDLMADGIAVEQA